MGVGMSRDRQDGRLLSLLALQVLLDYGRAGAIRPPVTVALLAANTLLYLRPGNLDALLPRLPRVLFNPHLIIEFGDLRRFLFSVFFHTSEPQFVMNMSSLLWRGGRLEEYMGSFEFASMVASLIGLSQGFTLLLSKGLLLLGNDTAYYQYSSGFSGVLLGMQVLNARAGDIVLFGVCIPAKYAELAQLFLMQALIHEVNIVGNLSGILAGLTSLWLKNGPDPLSDIANVVSQSVRFARGIVRSAARRCQSCSGRRVLASVPRRSVKVCGDARPAVTTTRVAKMSARDAALRTRTMLSPAEGISKMWGTGSSRSRRSALEGSKDLRDDGDHCCQCQVRKLELPVLC